MVYKLEKAVISIKQHTSTYRKHLVDITLDAWMADVVYLLCFSSQRIFFLVSSGSFISFGAGKSLDMNDRKLNVKLPPAAEAVRA